jgi:hypothetical protein
VLKIRSIFNACSEGVGAVRRLDLELARRELRAAVGDSNSWRASIMALIYSLIKALFTDFSRKVPLDTFGKSGQLNKSVKKTAHQMVWARAPLVEQRRRQ